ncbi:hypothetical protein [Helicobacter typhlonius]|uniref:hypothetical protein n=2 Tax=Helicobacter typhlonius TaxID=76936 RepID=UPI002FE1CE3D
MKGIFLISLVASLICAEELQLHKLNVAPNTPLSAQNTESKEGDSKIKAQVSKNFSIRANTIANEGYSEFELETGKANLNEFDAPISRYRAGMKLNYSFKPDARVKLNFFLLNALEINTQRRGGKVKPYNDGTLYEENTYDYGSVAVESSWVNSVGVALTILGVHRISLTMKQTQFAGENNSLVAHIGFPTFVGSVKQNSVLNDGNLVIANPFMITTQSFLTYTYVF